MDPLDVIEDMIERGDEKTAHHFVHVVSTIERLAGDISDLENRILLADAFDRNNCVKDKIAVMIKKQESVRRAYEIWKYFLAKPEAYFYAAQRMDDGKGDEAERIGKLSVSENPLDRHLACEFMEGIIKEWKSSAPEEDEKPS